MHDLCTLIVSSMHLARLRHAGVKLKFCTNETLTTRRTLVEKLKKHGFTLSEDEVHSPTPACVQFLREKKLRPFLIGELSY